MYHHHFLEAELRDELEQAGWRLDEYTTYWYGHAMATPRCPRQRTATLRKRYNIRRSFPCTGLSNSTN